MGIRERKEREKRMRREQMMNAASELFMLRGFSSTTMEEIAKRAELSPALIYQYFKNKDELYASLNLSSLNQLCLVIKEIHSNDKLSGEEKLLSIKDVMYDHFQSNPLLVRTILHVQLEDTLPNLSEELLGRLNEIGKKVQDMISEVFRQGVKEGRFTERHPVAIADIVWAIFTGLVVWEEAKRKIDPERDFLKSTLEMAFEIFCKGLR